MPPIDAATLARLRARYAPEPPGACPFCRGAGMLPAGTDDAGYARWRCPSCGRTWVTEPGDPDVLALLDDYDELADALAEANATCAGWGGGS